MTPAAVMILALATYTALIVSTPSSSQAGQQDERLFRTYTLRHADVNEVHDHLEQLLAGGDEAVEIVVDAQRHHVLISGNDEIQEMARQLVEAIDRPDTHAPTTGSNERGELRVYEFHGTDLQRMVDDLRSRYSGRADVRVSADHHAGQLVLFATPQEHAAVLQEMGTLLRAVPLPLRPQSPAGPTMGDATTQFVELRTITVGQFEQSLVGMFGSRLAKMPLVSGGLRGYILSGNDGRRLQIGINDGLAQVSLQGSHALVGEMARVVAVLDRPRGDTEAVTRIVPLRRADPVKLQEAFRAYRGDLAPVVAPKSDADAPGTSAVEGGAQHGRQRAVQPAQFGDNGTTGGIRFVSMLFQEAAPSPGGGGEETLEGIDAETAERIRELGDDVDIEMLPDLDVVILRGSDSDVAELIEIIQEIERISAENVPRIEVYELKHASSDPLGQVIAQVRTDFLVGRQGRASVYSLNKPNAMLVIGWGEAMDAMLDLFARLDQPVDPQAQLQVFRLKYAQAAGAQQTISQFLQIAKAWGQRS